MTKFVNRLVWYPVVLVASWTFATINRIQNAVNPDHPVFALFLLHVSHMCVSFYSFRCGARCVYRRLCHELAACVLCIR